MDRLPLRFIIREALTACLRGLNFDHWKLSVAQAELPRFYHA
jgi:hypothetical protein